MSIEITRSALQSVSHQSPDIHRHRSVDSLLFQRHAGFSVVGEPSEEYEWQSIRIDDPGQLRNDGGARVVLEYDRET